MSGDTEKTVIEHSAVQTEPVTPMQMLQAAVERGTDMDQLQKLMELHERWEANQARKAFTAAMSAFRAEAPVIGKNAEVDFTSPKGRTHYRHASLDHICEEVNPILARHGLSYSWVTEQANGNATVHCDVTHVQGHKERVTLTGPYDQSGNKNSIQAIGSAVTYLQRYTLVSALGLATGGQDDDGLAGGELGNTITEGQAKILRKLIASTKTDESKFLQWAGAESVEQIPAGKWTQARQMLERKAKENKQ